MTKANSLADTGRGLVADLPFRRAWYAAMAIAALTVWRERSAGHALQHRHHGDAASLAGAFVAGALGARTVAAVARNQRTEAARSRRRSPRIFRFMKIGDVRVHHIVPGIAVTATAVGVAALGEGRIKRAATAILGVGLGVTLDEFALALHHERPTIECYWGSGHSTSARAVAAAAAVIAVGSWVTCPARWRRGPVSPGKRFVS